MCVCVVATHKENFPLGYTGKLKSYSLNEYIRTAPYILDLRWPFGGKQYHACALNNMRARWMRTKKLLLFPPIAIHPHSNNCQFISEPFGFTIQLYSMETSADGPQILMGTYQARGLKYFIAKI
jgi:hypothetical protein